MRRPLEGLTVVDLTIWLYGPLAATLLADLGARVIKIERPGAGDFTRSLASLHGASLVTRDAKYLSHELFNRNKESVTLDLRAQAGQAVFAKLIAGADAFVTNFQPSTLAAFDALPSTLLARHPRLVYGLGAGLGTRGSLADVPSQDTAAMAYAGYMYTSSSEADVPFYPPGGMGDVLAGTNLAFGVTAALLGRERARDDGSPGGGLVTTSLLQSLMWTQMVNIGVPLNSPGEHLRTAHRTQSTTPLMSTYKCSDGGYIALGNPYLNDAIWGQIVRVLESPELASDARFKTEALRRVNVPEIIAALDARFAANTVAAWVTRCRAHDVWCSPVNRPEDLERDAAVVAQEVFATTDSGVRHVRAPFTLEGVDLPTRGAPPLGASTASVLASLGFSPEEIARLRAANVV